MPAEWGPHMATWMQFPTGNYTFGPKGSGGLARFQRKWAEVANTIAVFEPVLMVVHPDDLDQARSLLGDGVEIYPRAIDDAWARDSGPTFLRGADGALGAVHWTFNAWGQGGHMSYANDALIGGDIALASGARLFRSRMVNEGGGIHVDGNGTVMITRTVQLDPDRNPGWSEDQVEEEIRLFLGAEKVIWLERGLTKDYDDFGTSGHVDILATFTPSGSVLVHVQSDPAHPDHAVSAELLATLASATNAAGERLRIVEVPAPRTTHDDEGIVDWSYINHYVCNGAVIACVFDDPNDGPALATLAAAYPGREIVPVDARHIFECGGGVHCITQQVPA